MKQRIQLSDHFTLSRLLRFTLPSIIMMVFTSAYSVVDGLFVANLVGESALSSINIVYPLFTVVGAFGFMLGTGGSAQVARTLGEGENQKAKRYFTTICLTIVVIGALLSAVCVIFIRPLSYWLGATENLIDYCVTYGIILSCGMVAFMLQTTFQSFFVVAEKPKFGLALTIASGLTNAFLDWLFIAVFDWGLAGAAFATVAGYCVGGLIPLLYFILPNNSLLRFVKTSLYPRMLLASCANGSSEMVSNISMAIVTFLFNWQMLRLVGEGGVAAITAILYLGFIFIAILIGFSIGVAPVIGFHFGARNREELQGVFKKSMYVVAVVSVAMAILAELVSVPLIAIFLGKGNETIDMAVRGFRLYALSFLLTGFNIFASAFFTALCDGKVSALISFLRTLLLQVIILVALPFALGVDGVWLAAPLTEFLAAIVSIVFLIIKRKKYGY